MPAIYSAFRQNVIQIYAPVPTAGSAEALVTFSVEGASPLQMQLRGYAYNICWIDIVCRNGGGGIVGVHNVVTASGVWVGGSWYASIARTYGFTRQITIPATTVYVGVDIAGDASNFSTQIMHRIYSPRSLTVLQTKR